SALSIIFAAIATVVVLKAPPGVAMLPDGERAPVVFSASVAEPGRHNAILEADLLVEAADDGAIVSYEYRWNRATVGSIHVTDAIAPVVDYAATTPDTRWALEVRAVDDHNWRSEWVVAFDGTTPSAPNLIVEGDSVASGYERRWFTSRGTCVSPASSYGATVRNAMASHLPPAWSPHYRNVARAGAGVFALLHGGTDPCDASYTSQVDDVVALADPTTWNVVVTTAGINSTNWGDVITKLTGGTAFVFSASGDRDRCETAVDEQWNLDDQAPSISRRTAEISNRLLHDTNARLYWTSYYTITGQRLVGSWSPIGDACSESMTEALDRLHAVIRSELPDDVTWVDVDREPVALQAWGGWPHPSGDGHAAIGRAVAAAIVGP
ncbi:MAG: hypothetical protein KDB69_07720, partial [Acidimicrobiia bacterium]|nr:hypothetical protein [Acidimicrobiia bacterium]